MTLKKTLVGICTLPTLAVISLCVAATISHSALALEQAELDTSRAIWDSSGVSDYQYLMQRSCFCFEEYTQPGIVDVRADVLSAVRHLVTHEPLDPQYFLTVDQLFDVLQNALATDAFAVDAQFDSVLGYPFLMAIDYYEFVVDDEVSYTASGLMAVPELSGGVLGLMALTTIGTLMRVRRPRVSRTDV